LFAAAQSLTISSNVSTSGFLALVRPGYQLDPLSAELIPANMIGRFLDDSDLGKLHQTLVQEEAARALDATSQGGKKPTRNGSA
jgi:hypothetical protein